MKRSLAVLAAGLIAGLPLALAGTHITIPLNAQINVGRPGTGDSPAGNAIYLPPGDTVNHLEFRNDEAQGYTRMWIGATGYHFGPYIDLYLAGYNPIDITQSGARLEFDARYYQDIATNSAPYNDAPIFLQMYTYSGDTIQGYRDYGMVYQTGTTNSCTPRPPGGMIWTHVSVPIGNLLFDSNCDGTVDVADHTVNGGGFNAASVSRLRFWGTDWWGGAFGDIYDWVDFKNLQIIVPCKGDLTGDNNTDLSDLALILSTYGCDSNPQTQWDSGGFESYSTGIITGQNGWTSTTFANGGDPNVYVDGTIVADPTGGGHGKVLKLDAPNGDMNGWVGEMILLSTPIEAGKAIIEWDQYRDDLSDNIWYSDDGSYGGWWSLQWDQSQKAHADGTFGPGAPLTAAVWQHVKYTFTIATGVVEVNVDGNKASGSTTDTSIAGIELEDQTTPTAGHGAIYFDNLKISHAVDCVGDFTGDGVVSLGDLAYILADYGCLTP